MDLLVFSFYYVIFLLFCFFIGLSESRTSGWEFLFRPYGVLVQVLFTNKKNFDRKKRKEIFFYRVNFVMLLFFLGRKMIGEIPTDE